MVERQLLIKEEKRKIVNFIYSADKQSLMLPMSTQVPDVLVLNSLFNTEQTFEEVPTMLLGYFPVERSLLNIVVTAI